jgi:hypothetical protein
MSGSFTFTSCSPPASGTWANTGNENCYDLYAEPCTPYNTCGHTNPSGQSCSPIGATCMKVTTSTELEFTCQ